MSTTYIQVAGAIRHTCLNDGFEVLELPVIFPMSEAELLSRVADCIEKVENEGGEVVLAVYDGIVSIPSIILPFEKLTRYFESKNILSCIDGAQVIGAMPVNLPTLAPDFFITYPHKWLYVPRSCTVLYVDKKVAQAYGASSCYIQRVESWIHKTRPGTSDVTNYLCAPASLEFIDKIGGLDAIMEYNHNLAKVGGEIVARHLNTSIMTNPSTNEATSGHNYFGSMVTIELPSTPHTQQMGEDAFFAGLKQSMMMDHKVACFVFKHGGKWFVRLSAQVYLSDDDFNRVGKLLRVKLYGY
ncbi:hypothetical protein HDU79_010282 [Rhizoclosmatium sp. JEL0117]|nr:hypothetical protein HDU79_010282 [Rhizoclosmatium sp. JEL0117]